MRLKLVGFEIDRTVLNVSEDVGRSIYLYGGFEREEVRFLEANVKADDTCFDVGANIGYFSLLMAKLAPRGTVHAFGPVPSNFHSLSTNVMLNQFTNVHRNALAISDAPGSAEFTIAADGAYSSFIDTKRKLVQSKFIVAMTSLDAYCEANAIARIDCRG